MLVLLNDVSTGITYTVHFKLKCDFFQVNAHSANSVSVLEARISPISISNKSNNKLFRSQKATMPLISINGRHGILIANWSYPAMQSSAEVYPILKSANSIYGDLTYVINSIALAT